MAKGSTLGKAKPTSLVATLLTQSVEPGKGTSSTSIPSLANQPILVAIANGVAAALTVRAHQPTLRCTSGAATVSGAATTIARASASGAGSAFLIDIVPRFLRVAVSVRSFVSPTGPRRARAYGPGGCSGSRADPARRGSTESRIGRRRPS